ncbi:hypothetical protein Tco_0223469 [Tanacetum coccineum]
MVLYNRFDEVRIQSPEFMSTWNESGFGYMVLDEERRRQKQGVYVCHFSSKDGVERPGLNKNVSMGEVPKVTTAHEGNIFRNKENYGDLLWMMTSKKAQDHQSKNKAQEPLQKYHKGKRMEESKSID